MRKFRLMAVIAFLLLLVGCATPVPIGFIYTEIKMPYPVSGESGAKATKVGTSECTSVLGCVATGDASINSAKANAGITKISHVDWEAKNILGVIGKYKVTVYGE